MNRKNVIFGSILVIAGLYIALNTLGLLPGFNYLYLLSAGFIAAYLLFDKNLGFLIPGCILGAIALFSTAQSMISGLDGSWFIVFLATGFLAIFLIHTLHVRKVSWGERYWPLFPAASLLLIGSFIILVEKDLLRIDLEHLKYLNLIFPAAAVITGVIILARSISGRNSRSKNS
jgi:hypothetical protein